MAHTFLLTQSKRLNDVVTATLLKFESLSTKQWDEKPTDDGWSKKEILGHLIDSAANNHLRFVRAQLADQEYVSFAYEQRFFVSSQNYQNRNASDLIQLWQAYNFHLAHVIANMDPEKLNIVCKISHYEPVTLEFLVKDYVDHLEHHLTRILS